VVGDRERDAVSQCPLPPGMRAVFAKLAAELGVEGLLLEPELTETDQ
jgi:hypothetical protein